MTTIEELKKRLERLEKKTTKDQQMDPWINRSSGMRCRTCMSFVIKGPLRTDEKSNIGRCRRHAPTMNGYPVCFEDDWCGDHKLDENKV